MPYYEQWPFALVPADDPIYDLVLAFRGTGHPVVSEPTFGKWGAQTCARLCEGRRMWCSPASRPTAACLSTALGAADAGVRIRVAADACAGLSDADHQRALDAMALYAPLIEITDSASVLGGLG